MYDNKLVLYIGHVYIPLAQRNEPKNATNSRVFMVWVLNRVCDDKIEPPKRSEQTIITAPL